MELPRIPTSYAAALASAATSLAPTMPSNTTVLIEKKKRKPDFPVRKQDSEMTETIVPSKKRKFFQLFQWCHSADPTTKKNKKKNSSGNKSKSPAKPKMKPKLKGKQLLFFIAFSSGQAENSLVKLPLMESTNDIDQCPVEVPGPPLPPKIEQDAF